MRIDDLELINSVSEPTVDPSGSLAVAAVSHPDFGADAYVGQLWQVPLNGSGTPRRLTRGFHDTAPQFSPDGALIAFLRSQPGGAPQLQVVRSAGGEPLPVTDRLLGVSDFGWSPDSTRLVFISGEPESGRYGSVDGVDPGAEPARRIDTLKYRSNGLGYHLDRPAQVFVVQVPDVDAEPVVQPVASSDGAAEKKPAVPQARKISRDAVDHELGEFSPDGRSVAVIAAAHPSRDTDLRSDLWLLDVEGEAEPQNLTGRHGAYAVSSVAWANDDNLYFVAGDLGPDGIDFVGRNNALFVLPRRGDAPRPLTQVDDHDIGVGCSTVLPRDDGSVLVVEERRGTEQLLQLTINDDDVTTVRALTSGPIAVSGVAAPKAADGPIVISYSHPGSFGDLGLVGDQQISDLTDFSAAVREQGLVAATEHTITGRDGYPVHGWLAVPEGEGPFPVLLMIHGGPFAAYSVGAFDETQILVDAGYAVAYCNPRGSRGYGEEHGRAIRQAMGTVDLHDVLDFLDGVIAADQRLDGGRTGILGGSYGGYLTAWTIAHDHRFAGAVVERGYLDPELFFGTSDIGSFFGIEYVGTDPERIAAQSPQAVVGSVTTPTLVMHSEDDLRCPLSQAERYYAALKRQGTPTELVVFPGENHELSRSGRPRHRRQRFEVLLEWWRARFLDHG